MLAACFVTDLGTVVALGLIFAPFTMKTVDLPRRRRRRLRHPALAHAALLSSFTAVGLPNSRPSFCYFACSAWARLRPGPTARRCFPPISSAWCWPGPSARIMRWSGDCGRLTFGLLTPFYFIRAGSFVSIPALVAAPGRLYASFSSLRSASKIVGVYPVTKFFKARRTKRRRTRRLLMSTGLTFGTISSLFGLTHGIINQAQYSALVATVIASAVIPTVIANAFYLPRHLLPERNPSKLRSA